jgi:hypothetical protein
MNIVGTPCSAVQPLGLDGLEHAERIEGFARDDHGRAVRDAGQVGQDHSEAVIEGDGNAEPVIGTEAEGLSAEVAVVEDVVVRERGAFGSTGRAAGELDVDRIVEAQLDARRRDGRAAAADLLERK